MLCGARNKNTDQWKSIAQKQATVKNTQFLTLFISIQRKISVANPKQKQENEKYKILVRGYLWKGREDVIREKYVVIDNVLLLQLNSKYMSIHSIIILCSLHLDTIYSYMHEIVHKVARIPRVKLVSKMLPQNWSMLFCIIEERQSQRHGHTGRNKWIQLGSKTFWRKYTLKSLNVQMAQSSCS